MMNLRTDAKLRDFWRKRLSFNFVERTVH